MRKFSVLEKLLLVVAIASLVFAALIIRAYSVTPANGPYYLTGPPMTSASYEVGQFDNGSYYMINGSNWHTDFVSTNATTLFLNLFSSSWTGGTVFIKAGTYLLNSSKSSYWQYHMNNTILEGEGATSILKLADGQDTGSTQNQLLGIGYSQNVTIRDLTLDGNFPKNNGSNMNVVGIYILSSLHVTVEDCFVKNFRHFGIWVNSFSTSAPSYDIKILRNTVINCLWNGISFAPYGGRVYGCTASQNYVEGSGDIGIDTYQASSGGLTMPFANIISDNVVNGYLAFPGYGSSGTNDGAYGIRIESGGSNDVHDNTIYGCEMGVGDSSINAVAGSGNMLVHGNIIYMNASQSTSWAGIQVTDPNVLVYGNFIYTGFTSGNVAFSISSINASIQGNYIYHLGSTTGDVGISNAGGYKPNGTIVGDNTFSGLSTGITFPSGSKGQVLMGNVFISCGTDLSDSSTGIKKHDNIGSDGNWMTEA